MIQLSITALLRQSTRAKITNLKFKFYSTEKCTNHTVIAKTPITIKTY